MAATATAREKLPTPEASLTAMILKRIAATPSREAFRAPTESGGWRSLTWKETGDDISNIAAGLIALGLEPEQRVGIAADTSLDWVLADLGVALAGGAVTTVYASTGAEDVVYILADSDTKILFAENDVQLAKVSDQRDKLPELKKVILFEGKGDGDWVITLEELREQGKAALAKDADLVKTRAASVTSDQLATLIYTSGTTGKPKGVELTQGNWGYVGAAIDAINTMNIDDVQYLWLPMAHVFGSVLIAAQVQVGFTTAVDGRVPKIVENLGVIQPTFMGAVPRIFEKVYAAVNAAAKAEGGVKAKLFDWAIAVGKQYANAEIASGKKPGGALAAKHALADKLVLSKVRARMGGRIRFFLSGSAPLANEIAEFFAGVGMPILEGYALTETSAIVTLTRMDNQKFGTVGEVAPGTEIKIASDGEILVRGGGVMRGYHNKPEATAEVFVGEGYFATGDIGEIDSMGRLRITDRKKDLFKTSGGKYVAPSAIEAQFKAVCGIAGNMVVHANNRKFVSALITLDPDAVAVWAKANGKPTDIASLSTDPVLTATIQAAVDQLNSRLNKWEQIKKFKILDRDFTIEEGELTPSMKVKRKVVEERYRDLLDSLYT